MRPRSILADIPQNDELSVHLRLENWGRWCRVKPRFGRAQSAEGGYRPEAGNVFDPPEPKLFIDPLDAEVINGALLKLAHEFRWGLRMRYFERRPDRIIAKKLAVPRLKYQPFMRRARLMVMNVLRFRRTAYNRPPNSLRVGASLLDLSPTAGAEFPQEIRGVARVAA